MKVTHSASHIAGALVAAFSGIALVGIIAYYVRPRKTQWEVPQLSNTLRKRVNPAMNGMKAHFNNVSYNAGTRSTPRGSKADLDDIGYGKCGEPPNKHIKLHDIFGTAKLDGFGYGESILVAPPDDHSEFRHAFAASVTTALDFSNNDDMVPGSPGGDRHVFDYTASTVSATDTRLNNSEFISFGELPPATTPIRKSEHATPRKTGPLPPIVGTPELSAPKNARSRNNTISGNHANLSGKWSHGSDSSTSPVSPTESKTYEGIQDVLNVSGSVNTSPVNPIESKTYENLQDISGSTNADVADRDRQALVYQNSSATPGDEEKHAYNHTKPGANANYSPVVKKIVASKSASTDVLCINEVECDEIDA